MASDLEKQDGQAPEFVVGTHVYKGIKMFPNEIEEIQTMEIKEDDIFVCTFPRSGTTLIQEMVYLIMTLDFEKANSVELDFRVPYLDMLDEKLPNAKGIKGVEVMNSPRMVKCHLHHFLLPEQLREGKGKIIYSMRNPKDSLTSLCKLFYWVGELNDDSYGDFIEEFINGTGFHCPWTRHVLEYWRQRNDKNVLFLQYEEFSRDRPTAIRRIAKFLERDLTDEDVEKISQHCSIENMKNNKMTNLLYLQQYKKMREEAPAKFINQGKFGGWRDFLTEDQSARIDKLIDEVEAEGVKVPRT